MKIKTPVSRFFFLSLLVTLAFVPPAVSEEVTASIHVHSIASKGHRDVFQIAKLAKRHDIDVVILTDSLWERYEYGIAPFQGVLKKKIERDSILKFGVDKYFDEIQEVNKRHPELLFIGAASVTPHYYWKGDLFKGNLTLRGRAKDMLVFGLGRSKQLEELPVMGLKNAPYTPYEGNQYLLPYQRLIDHVNREGGFVYWSHPLAAESLKTRAFFGFSVSLKTDSYERDLLKTEAYSGFGIDPVELAQIHLGQQGLTIPGGIWDKALLSYTAGVRRQPIWVLGEIDYTGNPHSSPSLATLVNVLRVNQKSETQVLDAIQSGRNYLVMPNRYQAPRLSLIDFYVQDTLTKMRASSAQTANVMGQAIVHFSLAYLDGRKGQVTLQLIRDGQIMKQWDEQVPVVREIRDERPISSDQKAYYRLIVYSEEGDRLLTNPIFAQKMDQPPS